MTSLPDEKNPYLSKTFKLFVLALIFFLIFFHLYTSITFPETDVIPREILLGIALACVVYLWTQELRDSYRLQTLNKALVEAQEDLKDAEIAMISSLILTEEAKDPYVRGHSKRVAQFCVVVAQEMGFTKKSQRVVERAGILHDLGKIGIADDILKKPGKLDRDEWRIMKRHPQTAIDILKPLKFLNIEKEIILHHHERWDGQGYPDGLKGEEIPLEARIMAIADTFDAMNSARSYRDSLPQGTIIDELKVNAGTQFDPALVPIFLRVLEKNPFFWKKD